MKKRFTYGTVMIDIETKRIIDILPSRDSDDVIEWLKTYPNLGIISQDGSLTYAAAIRKAHPNAIQVSDRFHLLKNLTDYCKSYITKTLNFKVKIKTSEVATIDTSAEQSFSKRDDRISKAKALSLKGLSLNEISLQLKMDIRTVKKYININPDDMSKTTAVHASYGTKRESKLVKYHRTIDDLMAKGYTFKNKYKYKYKDTKKSPNPHLL